MFDWRTLTDTQPAKYRPHRDLQRRTNYAPALVVTGGALFVAAWAMLYIGLAVALAVVVGLRAIVAGLAGDQRAAAQGK